LPKSESDAVRGAPIRNDIPSNHPKPFRIFFHANALLIC
jgi:hypothetical protein